MLALCVFSPDCEPPKPSRFGIVGLDTALTLARWFVQRGAIVEIHEYLPGREPTLVRRLEPEPPAGCGGE